MSNYTSLNRTIGKEAAARLSHYNKLVETGSDTILTTPLLEGNPNILEEWDAVFTSLSAETKLVPDLIDSEISNREKFGPRSIAKPWSERKESLLAYFEKGNKVNAVKDITPDLIGRLRPLSLAKTKDYIKRNTNSGLPYLKKKGLVIDDALANISKLQGLNFPAVLFTRTQENNKTRNVWGFPIADTINEMTYYRPLLDYQREQFWRAAIVSPEAVDLGVTALMNYAKENSLSCLSIDFSSYDASLKPYLIREGFKYIKKMYQSKYHPGIDQVCERFITIGICTPDGILNGEHGVPSGSTFTNEIDSICQYLIAMSYPHENLFKFQIQGDDGLYACKEPNKLMEYFESFGLSVNKDKSLIRSDTSQYLQMIYNKEYSRDDRIVGVYPTYRALLRLCYLERFTDFSADNIEGKDYFAIRALSILENCKYHPFFEDLVKFIVNKDKYSLNPSDQGISNYIKLREKQDGKDINFNIYQYGDYASGIKSFDSYQLMKSYLS